MTDPVAKPLHERIADPVFRQAVAFIDAGDVAGLGALLDQHPSLTQATTHLPGEGYFESPTLLEFIAENPIRNARLPDNIADIAQAILAAGPTLPSINATLGLVCSGRIVREYGHQHALIAVLCAHGADPNQALRPALGHGERAAVEALLIHGTEMDLPAAAGLGRLDEVMDLLEGADPEQRHLALAYAAQQGHARVVTALLEAGEDPDRFNPPGAHAHSTPLHQAALAGHVDTVNALLAHGARRDLADKVHQATPWQWAAHAGHSALADRLKPRI